MRRAIVFFLLIITLLPTVSQWGTIAYFQLNRDYIAKVLCQNRKRPQLNCNGKCYLARKLKQQQDKQDKETTKRVESIPVLQLFAPPLTHFLFKGDTYVGKEKIEFRYQQLTYRTPVFKLLRPPRDLQV